jgi:predicted Zn-dependent protease
VASTVKTKRIMKKLLLLHVGFVLVLALPSLCFGHLWMHEQIADLTRQIKATPKDAGLYLKRGELHRAHEDWRAAQADYTQALHLDPTLDTARFGRARMFFEQGKAKEALPDINAFLAQHPEDPQGLLTRARIHARLKNSLSAAADFTRALAHIDKPDPEIYIERAQALIEAGEAHRDEALQGLEEGMRKLGPIVTLELPAIDIEVKKKDFAGALARIDRNIARLPRKESWLLRRGEVLLAAGRTKEAHVAFQAALEALEDLPDYRRRVPQMAALEKKLNGLLLASSPAGGQ